MAPLQDDGWLGQIDNDGPAATNERVVLRAPRTHRQRVLRNHFVKILDALDPEMVFLGRILEGPYFPAAEGTNQAADPTVGFVLANLEVQGELRHGQTVETNSRPTPGSRVLELTPQEVSELIGFGGDMIIGSLSGRADLPVALLSRSKDVLPRNIGIFGTVGAGKSNTVQVLVEEAARAGWATVMLDLESEYVDMDAAMTQEELQPALSRYGRRPQGISDFRVFYPVSCSSSRADSQPFTLRLADLETTVIAEILQTTLAERNALLDCVDHFESKFRSRVATTEAEGLGVLLDASPQAKVAFTLQTLRNRAGERAPRSNEAIDYTGVSNKLGLLMHSGVFDQNNMRALDVAEMVKAGRVTVLDVSGANDTIKNLVTADLLRKVFAFKMAQPDAPPTLVVIEEAHSFISREKAHTMQATLHMLRNVTRRGRKRWLSMAFVSQQPGHLPTEIFELCNTRIVHTLRSLHNLDALMATTSDVTKELWSRCPLLGTGEAILSSPQFKRSIIVRMRPASSRRRFVQ